MGPRALASLCDHPGTRRKASRGRYLNRENVTELMKGMVVAAGAFGATHFGILGLTGSHSGPANWTIMLPFYATLCCGIVGESGCAVGRCCAEVMMLACLSV